ncbi:MAG: 3-isopropylmalate dehydratase small subunit [Herpetosiphonaceae bacterium]|nr:MAG: 3-isopropylmalate dehydratase small subunit [Herpetosiphonaceae bacterium]
MARVWKFGEDVNTDQIVPGRYAPYMTSEAELRKYPFIEARPEFAATVRPGDIIVAGRNFGCGSSREYAPQALKLVGVGAIIAPLFARIFYRNALNLGLPLFEADLTWLEDGAEVELDLQRCLLHTGADTIRLPAPPDFVCEVWDAGGIVPYVRLHGRFPGGTAL